MRCILFHGSPPGTKGEGDRNRIRKETNTREIQPALLPCAVA